MKSLIVFILFVGMFLVISGVYEQRLAQAQQEKKIEYRFIPRSLYDEQLSKNTFFTERIVKPMFETNDVVAYDPTIAGSDINDF